MYGLGTVAQAIPGFRLWGIFAITLALGLVVPLSTGARSGLLAEIMPADGYVLGQSMLNMANGFIQVCGFALGGALLTVAGAARRAGRSAGPCGCWWPSCPGVA